MQENIDELDAVFVKFKPNRNEIEESTENIVDTLNNLIVKHQQKANGDIFDEVIENIEVSVRYFNQACIDKKKKVIHMG